MTNKPKAHVLLTKSKAELAEELKNLKTELQQLRVTKVTQGAASKVNKINVVRKSIAIVHTVTKQLERKAIRENYAGKKFKPLDIRAKKTRAIRRNLTKFEAGKKTLKQLKKNKHFPKSAYAVKE